ncbi:MAG: hypothetical protein QFX33_00440 [Candidatus Nezhaarchaeota archaeon]|nr:hypothetical protein [Candidatus Nezhaarchaeota archaeon]
MQWGILSSLKPLLPGSSAAASTRRLLRRRSECLGAGGVGGAVA